MRTNTRIFAVTTLFLAIVVLQACKHPLAIVGKGDIVDITNSGRGCTFEQFQDQDTACTENEVTGDYFVNYKAEPRLGWRFVRWEGPCSLDSDFQFCRLHVSEEGIASWDESHPDSEIQPSTAVFQPITGETGYLVAGTAVAGVAYKTATQQGVTGLDGSFQYEEGETIRFMIGDTQLGEVTGSAQVTPFDLAGSPVLTGIHITWALQDVNNPFHTLINLAVLLHSLDDDGDPDNGIGIRPGVASLLNGIALNLRKPWDAGEAGLRDREETFQPWITFQTDPTFRHLLGRANRKHRLSTPHGITKPSTTLSNLYEQLGIEPQVIGLRLLQEGPLDHESDSFETLYYDANGNITRHENTEFDQAYEIWLYDTEGKVTRHELHAEGANHHRIGNWRYDTRGNMSSFETYLEEDIGGTNRIDIRTYLYDLDSNPTQESFIIEENGNTNSHVVGFLYEYDKLGRLQQFTSKDNDGFNSWKFNARGNAIHREEHNGNNAEIWFYNSDGNVTRHEGSFPWSPEIWQYNADGKLVRYEQQNTWCDRGCYRLATTWEYDDSGHVVLRKLVNLEDDSVLEVDTWQYDESGRVILRKGDPLSGDEIITETWQYYANGLVKRHVIDGGNEELENQYDSKGNMTREAIFSFPETEKSIETWNYDVAGNLVYRGWDAGGVGIIDTATTYQYATTGWGHLFSGINVFGQPNRPPTKPSPAHEERPPE